MSVSYHGRAVIGCEITPHVPKTQTVSGCVHRHESRFCPMCGAAATTTVDIHLDDWLQKRGLDKVLGARGLSAVATTDNQRVFLGVSVEADEEQRSDAKKSGVPLSGTMIEAIKVTLKECLEPHGMWDEETFGLWSVMRVSY